MKAYPGKVTAFCLVRDRHGKPRFDDINNIPEPIWQMLTPEEQKDIENERNALARNP